MVLLVILYLALFFFPSSGARFSASSPVRSRRTVARGSWFRLQKTAESPQLQFSSGHRHPVRAADSDPQTIQQIIEIPLSPFVFGGRCLRYAGRAVSRVPLWRRHSCSHSCSTLRNCRPWFRLRKTAGFSTVALHQGRSHSCRGAEADPHGPLTMEISQLQFDTVFSSLLCWLCSSTT